MSEEISGHAIATDSSPFLIVQLTRLLFLILPLPLRFLFLPFGFCIFHLVSASVSSISFFLFCILHLPQICRIYSSAMGSEYEGLISWKTILQFS